MPSYRILQDTENNHKTWQDKRQWAQTKTSEIAMCKKMLFINYFLLWGLPNPGWGRCHEKSVESPSLVDFRTREEKALGNPLLLALPGWDGWPAGSWAPIQPQPFSEPDLAPWSGKSCLYGALKRRSVRISSQFPFTWDTTAQYVPTLRF